MNRLRNFAPLWLALLLPLLVAGWGLDRALDSYDPAEPVAGPAAGLLRSFLGNLSYQARGLLSRLLYLKIDRYVHEGEKVQFGDGAVGITMAGNTEIVPLYGLITYLDPHFIEAFSLGGNHLIYGLAKHQEGLALLEAGVELNPEDPLTSELLGQIAVHHSADLNRPGEAIPYLLRAYELRRRLRAEEVPRGFVFATDLLAGLLAVNYFRAGDRTRALRWLEHPNRLDSAHEIYSALGVQPPAVRPAPPEAMEHGHDHTEGSRTFDREPPRPFRPRWWEDPTAVARFHRSLASGVALVLLLATVARFRSTRRSRRVAGGE